LDCCATQRGLQRLFGRRTAQSEARAYRKNGVPGRLRRVLRYLTDQGVVGDTVLDIGFGVGAAHLELLRAGATHATGLELAPAYVSEARGLAAEFGLAGAVDYHVGDYARIHAEVPVADVVVLDRAVCCYPDWRAIIEPSAQSAKQWYVLVLPVDRWYVRAGTRLLNGAMTVIRHEYRAFAHPHHAIEAALGAAGLRRAFSTRTLLWNAQIYARA